MAAVTIEHLHKLYSSTDDPWHFRTSAYEQGRFESIVACLKRSCYGEILEIGCGNGELGRHLSQKTLRYVGLDASPTALETASRVVPQGEFLERFLPCELPAGQFELVVISEILYFLDKSGIASLAAQLYSRWPSAEFLCVNYLGPSGNAIQGSEALKVFGDTLVGDCLHTVMLVTDDYRIDRFVDLRGSAPT